VGLVLRGHVRNVGCSATREPRQMGQVGALPAVRQEFTQVVRQGAQKELLHGVWVVEETTMVSRQIAQSSGVRRWSVEVVQLWRGTGDMLKGRGETTSVFGVSEEGDRMGG
jgi:hypothetical protein